jgi:hypothetical protein
MVLEFTTKHTSLISRLLVGPCQTEPVKASAPAPAPAAASAPSKIQTLPAEIKLQILKKAANICELRNLVIACPDFYPVYCENRYRLLLDYHRKSHDEVTDIRSQVVVRINQLIELNATEASRALKELRFWRMGRASRVHPGRASFDDRQPSLADLREVSRLHCWIIMI